MDDEKVDRVRALYPRSMTPDPALLKPEYTQPGRRWIPIKGPYAGKCGAEHCATEDFSWVGLKFAGEDQYQAFPRTELKPAD